MIGAADFKLGLGIGGFSPIRTREWTAAADGCGVRCDGDTIRRTWLVHLGSSSLISCGRTEGRRVRLSRWQDRAAGGEGKDRASSSMRAVWRAPAQQSTGAPIKEARIRDSARRLALAGLRPQISRA